jgi:hypothetical protein
MIVRLLLRFVMTINTNYSLSNYPAQKKDSCQYLVGAAVECVSDRGRASYHDTPIYVFLYCFPQFEQLQL